MSRAKTFGVEATCLNLGAVVRVDGMVVFASLDHRPQAANISIDAYLTVGSRRLEVSVMSVPIPDDDQGEPPQLEVRLYKTFKYDHHESADVMVGATYVHGVQRLREGTTTPLVDHMFRVPERLGTWAWERAAPYDPNARRAVLATVEELCAALAGRDYKAVSRLLAVRISEIAGAIERRREDYEDELFEFLDTMASDQGFRVDRTPDADLVLSVSQDKRLVTLTDAMGLPPIVLRTARHTLPLGVSVANLEGKIAIVR